MKTVMKNVDKWHLEHLRRFAYAGKIRLPRIGVNILNNFDICDGKYQGLRVGKENRRGVQNFMLDNFYSIAPVPVVLELFKDRKMTDYLEDELDLFCDNGVSFGIHHGDQVVGAGLSLFVGKPQEKVDYVCAKEWHNSAAKLACTNSDQNPVYFWRNCQFLHLSHFCQRVIGEHDAKFGLHLSCLSLADDYRGKDGITIHFIKSVCEQVWDQGGVITTVANFKAFETYLRKHFPDNVQLLDKVAYSDLEFTVGGRRVFHPLEHLDSIRYLALVR
eukprot:GFUD01032365.1.p1 GENE.GFUD01032365.1~~GFUD01032365.1.p1  ORF type:complete len:274 (-),score=64.27 GFUD01032365.1:93-914(-)